MKKLKPFIDKYGRAMRTVWIGINYIRLQDNRGNNYLIKKSNIDKIL